MRKEIRRCEFEGCNTIIELTTHYCLKHLYELTKGNHHRLIVNLNIKEELSKISSSSQNSLYNEYLNILNEHPILFSELMIPSGKFREITRRLKYSNPDIHIFKFKKMGHRMEGIVYKSEHKELAAIKLTNIYPNLRLPKFLKI